VSGLYLTLPAVLGVLLLGEPLTWAKVVGLLLAMAAIYLLGSDGGEDAGSTAGTCAAEVGSAVVGLLSAGTTSTAQTTTNRLQVPPPSCEHFIIERFMMVMTI
jgi:drug/metabolite transporter (DMT)-like permease